MKNIINFKKISFSIDELIVLNATRDDKSIHDFANIINRLSNNVFIPVAAGGGIRTLADAEILFKNGADKVVLNSAIVNDVELVKELIDQYGSQSIIASIDYKKINGINRVYISDGSTKLDCLLTDYINYIENLNVGEIYLNSIDKDGTGFGYDFDTINQIKNDIKIPLIIAGGAGNEHHLLDGLNSSQVSAVATANLFNFLGDSLPRAREKIIKSGANLAEWK